MIIKTTKPVFLNRLALGRHPELVDVAQLFIALPPRFARDSISSANTTDAS
jgi:hypothetical protein